MPELIKPTITTPRTRAMDPWGALSSNLFGDFERAFEAFPRTGFAPMFRSPFFQQLTSAEAAGLVIPSMDVLESDKEITLCCELPGLDMKDIELTIDDGVLTLAGEKKFEKKEKSAAHMVERRYGAFRRSFTLPDFIDEKKIEAKFDKGVLTITLPKSRPARSKSIE